MLGAVWVVVERHGELPRRVSVEALGRAATLGGETVAVVLGADAASVATAVAPYACRVLVIEPQVRHLEARPVASATLPRSTDLPAGAMQVGGGGGTCGGGGGLAQQSALANATTMAHARLLAEAARLRSPRAILAGATTWGRDLMARLAARLRVGYVADAVELVAGPNGEFEAVRPVLGGRAYAHVTFRGDGPRLVTLRPTTYPPPAPGRPGTIETLEISLDAAALRPQVVERKATPSGLANLLEAHTIVAAGRGVRGPEGFAVAERLAEILGGAVGASRAAVDAGWRDHAAQIGKSGRTVSPQLYIALGISGAVHHRMGMDTARTVVVINQDPEAPFFKHADYGLVGDLFELAPALAEEVRRLRGS